MRALIYDLAITHLTAGWYRTVLERVPRGCRLLDVGIGTASALLANAEEVARQDVRVVGIDIDAAYVTRAQRQVQRRGLADRIEVRLESVYDHRGGPYDAAYFSASFMLLPDPPAALRLVAAQLSPAARVYFTQTFEEHRSPLLEVVKPMLKRLTTIDFGRVTYEPDFRRALADGGLEIEEMVRLDKGAQRSSVLAVARPSDAAA